ncbi:hypothetical protein B1H18_14010 [Streptomyces tsukubensis]|uniref:WCX domain-containing protein n=1 Tax=Streptomyces tsukubensis TaxID=83656 RepID=A0A1V4A9Z1_9ACTN|nr:hypothetical protein B1H18_14010 [Streptomyces tsukubensis]
MGEVLRRGVEERVNTVAVTARVRRDRLDMFVRLKGVFLTEEPDTGRRSGRGREPGTGREPEGARESAGVGESEGVGEGGWVVVRLGFGAFEAVHTLLSFGAAVEVVSPQEVRDELARVAAGISLFHASDDVRREDGRRAP